MPVSFLTGRERERLRRFPAEIPLEDVSTYFTLSDLDLGRVLTQRRDYNRLGFALQLCALRYLGFAPDDLSSAPDHVVAYVAQQLAVSPDAPDPPTAGVSPPVAPISKRPKHSWAFADRTRTTFGHSPPG